MFNKDNVEKILKSKGWTNYKLAKEAGLGQSTVHEIMNGKKKTPNSTTLQKMASALGVSVNAFFDDEEEINIEKSSLKDDFPIVPKHFTDPEEARIYVSKHQIFGYGGFNPATMCDEDILNFANEMINQAELLGLKYSIKNKDR